MKKILLIFVVVFLLRHYANPTEIRRFLAETNPIGTEEGTPAPHKETIEEEPAEEGIELHYEVGSKGFYI